jgi:hypothetical protein
VHLEVNAPATALRQDLRHVQPHPLALLARQHQRVVALQLRLWLGVPLAKGDAQLGHAGVGSDQSLQVVAGGVDQRFLLAAAEASGGESVVGECAAGAVDARLWVAGCVLVKLRWRKMPWSLSRQSVMLAICSPLSACTMDLSSRSSCLFSITNIC